MKNTLFGLTLVFMACASGQPSTPPEKPLELTLLGPKSIEIRLGQTLVTYFESYGSVGYGASWTIEDPTVIGFLKEETVYKNPEVMKTGMTGADDAQGSFLFRALKLGKTVLTVNHEFRGKVEQSMNFEITVLP